MPTNNHSTNETLLDKQTFVMSDLSTCSALSAKSQESTEAGRFVSKTTIKTIEPAHKNVSNVTINSMPVLKADLPPSHMKAKQKNQPTLLTIYGFATNDKRNNYLLKLRQMSDNSIVEPVLLSERLSLPVDQCLTVHDRVKKLKTSVLGLLEKYERVLYTSREKAGKRFGYTAIVADRDMKVHELPWLDLVHDRIVALHSIESIFLEYDRCMTDFTKLNNKYNNLLGEYNKVDAEIRIFERMNDTSLLSCSLTKYVNVKDLDDFFTTDYLTSCLIVVPKSSVNEFIAEYANEPAKALHNSSLSQFSEENQFLGVVPRSARKLKEDSTHVLFSVILFKKDQQQCIDYFREKRWVVREYIPEEAEVNAENRLSTLTHVKVDRERAFQQHVESTISACLGLAIDISILELYTEAQLRFGTEFQMLVLLASGLTKKFLKQLVNCTFSSLLNSCDQRLYDLDIEAENPYLPFVFCATKLADEAAIKAK